MKELPTTALPLPPLPRSLDKVCDRFEAAWKETLAGGPRLGEHTEEVLREVLGLDAERIRELRERGVV